MSGSWAEWWPPAGSSRSYWHHAGMGGDGVYLLHPSPKGQQQAPMGEEHISETTHSLVGVTVKTPDQSEDLEKWQRR